VALQEVIIRGPCSFFGGPGHAILDQIHPE
jgi:hypothetical protein